MKTEDIFDIDGPIKNARKRLDKWLARERLYLSPVARDKAAAKLARIFENENSDNPNLYQNFLTMIADEEEESDDLTQVQIELKQIIRSAYPQKKIMILSSIVVLLVIALGASLLSSGKFVVFPSEGTINTSQEKHLQSLVMKIIDEEDKNGNKISHAQIWNILKDKFNVSTYRDLPAMDFEEGKLLLEQRLENAQSE